MDRNSGKESQTTAKRLFSLVIVSLTFLPGLQCSGGGRGGEVVAQETPEKAFVLGIQNGPGGWVESHPEGIECAVGSQEYSICFANFVKADPVVLKAHPAEGFRFERWLGDCAEPERNPEIASVYIDDTKPRATIRVHDSPTFEVTVSCGAMFVAETALRVSLSSEPEGAVARGTEVGVRASVEGEGPFALQWQPEPVYQEDRLAVFVPEQTTQVRLSVESLSDHQTVTANLTIPVKLTAMLAGVPDHPLSVGEQVEMTVLPSGGLPPFSFQWTDGVQGNAETGRFSADAPGIYLARVLVTDQDSPSQELAVSTSILVSNDVHISSEPSEPVPPLTLVNIAYDGAAPEHECYRWFSGSRQDPLELSHDGPILGLHVIQTEDYWLQVYDVTCSTLLSVSDNVTVDMLNPTMPMTLIPSNIMLDEESGEVLVTAAVWNPDYPQEHYPLESEDWDCTWVVLPVGETEAVLESHQTSIPPALQLELDAFAAPGQHTLHFAALQGDEIGFSSAIVSVRD